MVNGRAHKSNFCVCSRVQEQYLLLVFIRLHGKRLTIDVLLDVSPGFLASPSRPESGAQEAARHCLQKKGGRFPVVFDAKQSCLVDLEKIKTFQSTETRVTRPVSTLFGTHKFCLCTIHEEETRQTVWYLCSLAFCIRRRQCFNRGNNTW